MEGIVEQSILADIVQVCWPCHSLQKLSTFVIVWYIEYPSGRRQANLLVHYLFASSPFDA